MEVIVIGNGVGGMSVASKMRSHDGDVTIEIYSDEPYGYYSRVWLPQLISGEKTVEEIVMREQEWYEKKDLTLHLDTRVQQLDVEEQAITLENGETRHYDKLCLCTGAHNWIPPIENSDLSGVFTLRTIDDVIAIKRHMKEGMDAVCIGGGLLGLETSRHLKKAGLNVTVVEFFPRLLPKQLCSDSSQLFQDKIEELGLKTVLGTTATEFRGNDTVNGVLLKDGQELDASIVIISSGIRPNLELVKDTPLDIGNCIIVNEYMQTSNPDIYAVGDVAEFQGKSWGIIPAALDQAPIAAKHMLGLDTEPYTGTTPSNKLKIMDFDLMSTGKAILDSSEQDNCRVFIAKDSNKGVYKKFVTKDDKLVGAILLEAKEEERFVKKKMHQQITEKELEEHLGIP